jgi:hypothetical protein
MSLGQNLFGFKERSVIDWQAPIRHPTMIQEIQPGFRLHQFKSRRLEIESF